MPKRYREYTVAVILGLRGPFAGPTTHSKGSVVGIHEAETMWEPILVIVFVIPLNPSGTR